MDIVERFISYTKIDTTSFENEKTPSTENQFILANQLKEELLDLGIEDGRVANNGFVYGTLKANCDCHAERIGLLAHMDTSAATSGKDIKARVIKNYDGKDIQLSQGIYSTVEEYPFLSSLKGQDIIVTDGTTLLGGDDKAGIAIIMDMIRNVQENNIKHGDIVVCFTPDEETGEGISHIDLNEFKVDYAYTLDGGMINDVAYENFNAACATIKFNGNSVHPGSAKNIMLNALQLAIDFHNMLPVNMRPEFTDGKDGFNHLEYLKGGCQSAESQYIIRNHDKQLLEKQIKQFQDITMYFNELHEKVVVELDIRHQYSNMIECFDGKMHIIEKAKKAIQEAGLTVTSTPIRGGTDGSQLSYMGIPTPNLGTGDYNCHGNHELVSITQMKEMVKILTKIIEITD